MRVFLTGGTGAVGSAVLAELVEHGHLVTAAVRSAEAAATVSANGGAPVTVSLTDVSALTDLIADSDAAVCAAAPSIAPEAANAAFVTASLAASSIAPPAAGRPGRPLVLTSGTWIHGSGEIVDDSALNPPAIVAWRIASEERLLAGSPSATVLAPGIVHGKHGGLYDTLVNGPRDDHGRHRLIGDGSQRWSWVHAEDLAVLYRLVIERGVGQGRVVAAQSGPPVIELVRDAVGSAGLRAETVAETRARFGADLGDALLLDQAVRAVKAESLGWRPAQGLPGATPQLPVRTRPVAADIFDI